MKPQPTDFFDEEQAATYDEKFRKLAPLKDLLHFSSKTLFSQLPENAHLLIVGAGTGAELLYFSEVFPAWQFTAVEPSAPMFEILQKQCETRDLLQRCRLHQGYLDTLTRDAEFDAATSFLVSHFITDKVERRKYFQQIAARLKPSGILINADLAGDLTTPRGKKLLKRWFALLAWSGVPEENLLSMEEAYAKSVAIYPPEEVEKILSSAGFDDPVLFLQTFLIHAWVAPLSPRE